VTDLEVDDPDASIEHIERLCQAQGLSITMKTIHWHLKKGKERGTLEITQWPSKNMQLES